MSADALTPIERGALLALMAASQPLRESADLRARYRIGLKSSHRSKLQRLGLIETSHKPMAHRLSKKGWDWAKAEIAAEAPKGQMGLGALYAVLHGLKHYLDRSGGELSSVFGDQAPRGNGSADHIREAAWSDADEALGQALQDMHVFTKARDRLREAAPENLASAAKRVASAADLVLQPVRLAARRRNLALMSEPGQEAPFNPVAHVSDHPAAPGQRVRVRKSPVIRGSTESAVIVIRGEVEPI